MKQGKRRSGGFICFGAENSDDESEGKRPPGGDGNSGEGNRGEGGSRAPPEDGHRRHHNRHRFRRVLYKIFRSPSLNRTRKESKPPPSPPEPISLYKQYEKSMAKLSRQSTEVDDGKSLTTISSSSSSDTSSLTSSSSASSTSSTSALMALTMAEHVPPRAPKAQREVQPPTSAATLMSPPPPPSRKLAPATRIALLLVMALTMLLVCGRIGAIVSMSLLFFYIARENYKPAANKKSVSTRRVTEGSPAARRRGSEVGEDMKKKVVMEGFLERHRRNLN